MAVVKWVGVGLCMVAFWVVMARKYDKRRYHPIAGTIFDLLLNFSRLHDYMTDLASRYTTYRLLAPFPTQVYTSDPLNVEYILKTNFQNYAKVIITCHLANIIYFSQNHCFANLSPLLGSASRGHANMI